mmetsp:Transcript_9430/g.24151  ORF Transcript_9430/g.24151 Transcript_9430/m.24151 type:complete len:95 (-) Transcript_9430:52-336(-)
MRRAESGEYPQARGEPGGGVAPPAPRARSRSVVGTRARDASPQLDCTAAGGGRLLPLLLRGRLSTRAVEHVLGLGCLLAVATCERLPGLHKMSR